MCSMVLQEPRLRLGLQELRLRLGLLGLAVALKPCSLD
tara:strand:- start:295 stop:408 length:114 start_codon:yes stop_codon:yes gene_type:complete